jgi:NAD-dependent SIR2 family protein deacetylase
LRSLTSGKDCFVLTSNADDLFERHGFDPALIWTRQGSYSRLQCLEPCSPAPTWDAGPWVSRAVPAVDLRTEELSDPALIPACPRCGGEAMLNVRGGDWFVETPYLVQGERFDQWLSKVEGDLLILDVGTGFNTPSVIRWPAERITAAHPRANLVRINPLRPEVPAQLGNRALGIPASGAALWSRLVAAQPR